MKLIRENKFKKGVLAVAISAALTGCNLFDDDDDSSSSSGSTGSGSSAQSTTFNVSLGNAPSTLASASFDWSNPLASMMSQAYADTTGLDETNFKVVIVDENGNAVEVFELTADQVEESPAGSGNYIIEAPGVPQLNCVIAVNVDGELQVQAGESLAASNALFAPTTSENIDVDLESTVAYQQFLESVTDFDEYDVDDPAQVAAVEQLVNNVEQQLESLNLEDYLDDANIDLEDLLTGEAVQDDQGNPVDFNAIINDVVDEIIAEQIDDIQSSTTTTIVSLVQNGGLNWFDADVETTFSQNNPPYSQDFLDLEVERGSISSTGAEIFYEYDFEEDTWGEGESFDPETDTADDDFVLTADGWVNTSDSYLVASVDADEGTVVIQDAVVSSVQAQVNTLQALDLAGKNIEEFLATNADEEELATFIDTGAVFGEGAIGVKISVEEASTNYFLRFDAGDDEGFCWSEQLAVDLGGNCERVWQNNSQTAPTTLDDLVSDTLATVDDIANSTTAIWFEGNTLIQLVETVSVNEDTQAETTERTAQFFMGNEDLSEFTLFTPEDDSTLEWSMQSPDGLAEGESLIYLPIPEELRDELDLDGDESVIIFAVQGGFVREGRYVEAGQTEDEGGEWVFNAAAADDILDAFDSLYQDTFLVDCFYESGWDDDAFEGLGAPIETNTLKAFEAAVNDDECGGVDADVTAAVLTANTWYEGTDAFTFNADGTGSVVEANEETPYDLTWSINTTANDNIPNGTIVAAIEFTENDETFVFTEHYAPVGYDDDAGTLSLKIFSTNSAWYVDGSDIPDGSGEIWTATFTSTQPETNVEETELR